MDQKLNTLFDTLEQVHRGVVSVFQGEQSAQSAFVQLEQELPQSRQRALASFKTSFMNHLGTVERHGVGVSGVRAGVDVLRRRASEI